MATTETTTAPNISTAATTQSGVTPQRPNLDLDLDLDLDLKTTLVVDENEPKLSPTMGCPTCGFDDMRYYERDAGLQRRIGELEAQIRMFNDKAAASAEKLADYEDEIRYLRSQANLQQTTVFPPTPSYTPASLDQRQQSSSPPQQQPQLQPEQQQQQQQQPQTRLATIASYLPYGKRNNSNTTAHQSTSSFSLPFSTSRPSSSGDSPTNLSSFPLPPNNNNHLQDALNREQELRKDAESRLSQANSELEDLTTQLFSQANEMVAEERRARAKLEERVEVLERRDREKRRRLDKLEQAIERVDRVRELVGR